MDCYIPRPLKDLMLTKGEVGRKWLEELPKVLSQLEKDWQIVLEKPFENCYCNYVAKGKNTKGEDIVLKIGFPDEQFYREIEYLKLQKAGPIPRLLRVDEATPALLLERIEPAETLTTLADEKAIEITAQLVKQLWKKVEGTHAFKTSAYFYQDFLRLKDQLIVKQLFSEKVILKAQQAYLALQEKPQDEVLLHGDLHQFNIIFDSQKGWLVIDPSGVVGEREYDLAAFLRNPPSFGLGQNLKQKLENRIYLFARELNLDPRRIYLWALFQTVLASFWAVEDKADFLKTGFVNVANALAEIEIG